MLPNGRMHRSGREREDGGEFCLIFLTKDAQNRLKIRGQGRAGVKDGADSRAKFSAKLGRDRAA